MGCCSSHTRDNLFEQSEPINLSIIENEELKQAQTIISLIIKIRNRIIYLYHKLIYSTGGCLYINPSMSLCVRNIFYKISAEFNGDFSKSEIVYMEDPPYLQTDMFLFSDELKLLLNQLFDFLSELRGYKNILRQIDNDSPTLLYLEYENKSNISQRNLDKIRLAMDLFKQLLNMRQKIWNQYKNEIQILVKQYEPYIKKVDKIGKEAYDKNLSDIYEICILEHKEDDDKKKKMYSSVEEAKHNWEDVMKNDYDTDLDFSINNL
jgi:hypothetical protein